MRSTLPYVLLLLLCHLTDGFQCVQHCYNVVKSDSSCTGPSAGPPAGKCLCKLEKAQHHIGCCIWSSCDDYTDPWDLLGIQCLALHNVNIGSNQPNASNCANTPFNTRDLSSSTPSNTSHPQSAASSGGISTGAAAGIGVGVTIGVLIVLGTILWIILARRRRRRAAPSTKVDVDQPAELDNQAAIHEKGEEVLVHEKGPSPITELSSGHEPPQADSSPVHELPADTKVLEDRMRS